MTLKELKTSILANNLSDNFLIFIQKDNPFLVEQYLEKIKQVKNCNETKIYFLAETTDSALSLVYDYQAELNVLRTDNFTELSDDYSKYKNCIVICNSVDTKIKEQVKEFTISFPVTTDWQTKEYIKTKCKGLSNQDVNWLYNNVGENLQNLTNELDKIALFSESDQEKVFTNLKVDRLSGLQKLSMFDLTNAIITKDMPTLFQYAWYESAKKLDPFLLISILLSGFRKSLLISSGCKLAPEELGCSLAQYRYLSKHQTLSNSFLISAIKFLSSIDFKIKAGELDISKEDLMNYIIGQIMSIHVSG